MASASRSVGLGNNYTLTAAFNETATSTNNNTSTVFVSAVLQANGARWQSSYLSNLKVYWHDNRENYDRLVANIDVSAKQVTGYWDRWEASGTITVTHKDDGSLSGYAYAVFTKGGSAATAPNTGNTPSADPSNPWTALTKINRYPMLSDAPNFNDEESPEIKYSTSLGFTGATVEACIANSNGSTIIVPYRAVTVANGKYTFDLTDTERNYLRNATPNSNSMAIRFYLRTTTTGGTQYFSYLDKTLSIVNANPTATYTELETNARVSAILGTTANKVVQNASVVRYTITPSAKKGSSITSVIVRHNNIDYPTTLSSGNYVVDIPIVTNTLQIYVKDSRGNPTNNAATTSITKDMIAYSQVDFRAYSFKRVNATSSDVNVSMESVYYQTDFNNTTNVPTVKYKLGEGNFVTIPSSEYSIDTTNHKISITNYTINDALPYTSSGTFTIQIDDLLTTDVETQNVTKGIPTFDAGEFDVKINGALYIAGKDGVTIGEIRNLIYPVNSVYMSTSSTDPSSTLGGTWTSLGNQTIGGTTVYYYKKTGSFSIN